MVPDKTGLTIGEEGGEPTRNPQTVEIADPPYSTAADCRPPTQPTVQHIRMPGTSPCGKQVSQHAGHHP
jgi:hypothetical protein